MPTYTIRSDTVESWQSIYVNVYHGSGYTWPIGLIDKKNSAFILGPQEAHTFIDHTESVTLVAEIIGKDPNIAGNQPKVWGTLNIAKNQKYDLAAWAKQTLDLTIVGESSRSVKPDSLVFSLSF
jgi:hypothetical protein